MFNPFALFLNPLFVYFFIVVSVFLFLPKKDSYHNLSSLIIDYLITFIPALFWPISFTYRLLSVPAFIKRLLILKYGGAWKK